MCRCRGFLIGGAKKGHGKISWPNPIEVLQQNRVNSCRARQRPARQLLTHKRHWPLVSRNSTCKSKSGIFLRLDAHLVCSKASRYC